MNLANRRGDILLHVNPRLGNQVLVLNAAPGGGWGGEDRKPLAIQRGHPFSMIIMVTQQGYKVNRIFVFLFDHDQSSQRQFNEYRSLLTINIQLIFLIVFHFKLLNWSPLKVLLT